MGQTSLADKYEAEAIELETILIILYLITE